jgi:hypothetical protein
MEEWLKPSDSGSRVGDLRECTGRNASERRASLEKDNAQADPTAISGKAETTGGSERSKAASRCAGVVATASDNRPRHLRRAIGHIWRIW